MAEAPSKSKRVAPRGFQVTKAPASTPKDLRLSLPADLWAAVELVASRFEVEPQEVIRQALSHALKAELRQVRKG